MIQLTLYTFESSLGTIRTAATPDALVAVSLPGESLKTFEACCSRLSEWPLRPGRSPVNTESARQLKAFLAGRLHEFDLPLLLSGTDFGKKVLRRVLRIGYGRTMSYGEVACSVGHPGAARAVGTIMARNPLPMVIPCHRVLAANGLGGYRGGAAMKARLLELEKIIT